MLADVYYSYNYELKIYMHWYVYIYLQLVYHTQSDGIVPSSRVYGYNVHVYVHYIMHGHVYIHVHVDAKRYSLPASLVLADTSGEVGPNPTTVVALIVNR